MYVYLSNLCIYQEYAMTIAFSFSFLIMQTPIVIGIYEA